MKEKYKSIFIEPIQTGKTAHGTKSKRVHLIIKEEMLSELDNIAEIVQVSRNSVIIHAIRKFILETIPGGKIK
mgnify:FL=1|tara:strand:- start:1249 stop:1467 length:219 start_codon:yes stop_codon:yes gene_type:complete